MRNQIIEGDALTVLKTLPDKIVQTCITSPPYWGLRSYKTEPQIWGGREDCEHEWGQELKRVHEGGGNKGVPIEWQRPSRKAHTSGTSGQFCRLCNAWRGELGLEPTPELYIQHIVEIFHELRRILRDDGTLFLNMGDSYWGGKGQNARHDKGLEQRRAEGRSFQHVETRYDFTPPHDGKHDILKPKDLCGIPWRVAMALQADGWWLRSDIIWNKPNPMPESCTDRPTRAHEYIFLLTKKARYYYDADAVREGQSTNTHSRFSKDVESGKRPPPKARSNSKELNRPGYDSWREYAPKTFLESGRNLRTVWTFATQPFPEAHFATFPEELVRRCILAGTAEQACPTCGAAWERVLSDIKTEARGYQHHENPLTEGNRMTGIPQRGYEPAKTLGFRPTCKHGFGAAEKLFRSGRCIVLDPFMGSGTVAYVALKLGRDYIGCELKPEYIKMANKRLKPLGNKPCPQQVEAL